ncbi:hypothetical protein ACHAXT_000693 [Thalassiosira profunda]
MSSPQKLTQDELKRHPHPGRGRAPPTGARAADDVAEQQPIMRAVAINPITQQRRLHFEPVLRRAEPAKGPLQGLRQTSNPELLKGDAPPKRAVPRSKSESALARKWHVDHAALPARPTDFPSLTTAREVLATPAHVISNRLGDCLQSRSIRTKFSKNESALAKCRNTDFCKFSVRLYAGEEGGVLVEIQRLCGDAVSFMRDCRALLDAAAGTPPDAQIKEETPLYLRLPVSEMAFVKECPLPSVSQEEEAESVNVAADLLSSSMSDSNMLGMESLAIMTDPRKTAKGTAILASRRILCPKDPGNGEFNMHNYVMSLLLYHEHEEEEEASDDSPATGMDDHQGKLRNLALRSLHNSLSLLSAERILCKTIAVHEEWYSSVLIPKLLRDLAAAERSPHDACYASRCLSTLAECPAYDFAAQMSAKGAAEALAAAEGVGKREFDLLRKDANRALETLRCC